MKKALIVLLIIVVAIGTTAYWYVSRLTAVAAPLVVAEETRRVIDTGELVGYVGNNGSSAWLGIPFARTRGRPALESTARAGFLAGRA